MSKYITYIDVKERVFLLGCTADRAFYMLLNHVSSSRVHILYPSLQFYCFMVYKFLNKLLEKYYQAIVRLYC